MPALGMLATLAADCASAQTTRELAERCRQLISFYDRYGVGRSNNSDGRRNHTRIGAEFDCQRGQYEKGIAIMEDLLRKKAFAVPPPRESVPALEAPEYGV